VERGPFSSAKIAGGGNHPREWAPAAIELLTLAQEDVSLDRRQAARAERLVDHHRESTGVHAAEVPKALVLPVPLLDTGAEFVGGPQLGSREIVGSADEHPILRLAVLIALAVPGYHTAAKTKKKSRLPLKWIRLTSL